MSRADPISYAIPQILKSFYIGYQAFTLTVEVVGIKLTDDLIYTVRIKGLSEYDPFSLKTILSSSSSYSSSYSYSRQ